MGLYTVQIQAQCNDVKFYNKDTEADYHIMNGDWYAFRSVRLAAPGSLTEVLTQVFPKDSKNIFDLLTTNSVRLSVVSLSDAVWYPYLIYTQANDIYPIPLYLSSDPPTLAKDIAKLLT